MPNSILCRLPVFAREDPGKTVSLLVNDVDALSALFDDGVLNMAADSLKVIGVLIMIFTRSLGLGLILIVITPLLFALTRHFQKRMLQAQKTNRAAIAQVNHLVPETLNLPADDPLAEQAGNDGKAV